jgi:hypothetical protein
MEGKREDLITALKTSVKELQQGIDMHCCLLTSIFEGHANEHKLRPLPDVCPKQSRELVMKEAIKEAIDELEESRKAFKSKRLEVLRKKLTMVLMNAH